MLIPTQHRFSAVGTAQSCLRRAALTALAIVLSVFVLIALARCGSSHDERQDHAAAQNGFRVSELLERFRVSNGTYPSNVNAFVEAYGRELPKNPYRRGRVRLLRAVQDGYPMTIGGDWPDDAVGDIGFALDATGHYTLFCYGPGGDIVATIHSPSSGDPSVVLP